MTDNHTRTAWDLTNETVNIVEATEADGLQPAAETEGLSVDDEAP